MLGRYDRAMRARQPVGRLTLLQQAIAAIRRNNGALFYVPQNALGDGAPNLLSAPEFAGGLADAPTRGGLITASTMTGYDGAIAFGHDGATGSYAYKSFTPTVGLTYTLSVAVKMDDGLPPAFIPGYPEITANPFGLVMNANGIQAQTYTVTAEADGAYRVSATQTVTAAGNHFGVVKYASNNNRTFKVTGYKLELGSTATAYTPQSVLRTRGVFIDSAGVSPVTNIADVIGRMTDRAGGSAVATQATTANKPTVRRVPKRLGPNLVSNGGFDSGLTWWTRGGTGTQTHESGAIRVVGDSATTWSGISETTIPVLTRGKQYLVQFSVLAENTNNGAGLYFRTSSLDIGGLFDNGRNYFYPSAVGNYSMLFTATVDNINQLRIIAGSESNASVLFDNISVKEVLEWTNAMSFDGSNDFLQTDITTGNEGWVCAGVVATDSNATVVCSGAGSASKKGIWMYRTSADDRLNCMIGNGTSTINASAPSVLWAANTSVVVEALWYADAISVGVNGTYGATTTRAGNASPPPTLLRIGAYTDGVTYPLAGEMAALVYCHVPPSAADRAIIRKWIGSLQGQTL